MRTSSRFMSLLVIACMCASMLMIAAPASASIPAGTMRRLTNDMDKQTKPVVDGDHVVYRSMQGLCANDNNGNWNIYMYDLATGVETPICTQPDMQNHPTIRGNIIAWMDKRNEVEEDWGDIYMYDLSTRQESVVCTAPGEQCKVGIGDGFITWVDERSSETPTDTGKDIYMKDLASGLESIVTTADGDQQCVSAAGDWIVWKSDETWPNKVWGYNVVSKETTLVAASQTGSYMYDPYISEDGKYVAWLDGSYPYSVHFKDMLTGEITKAPTISNNAEGLSISGDRIVYEDRASGNTNVNMYDISEATESVVASAPKCQGSPSISGNNVVWHDERWELFLDDDDDGDAVGDDPRPEICAVNLEEIVTEEAEVAGDNRYLTAIQASQQAFPLGADTVVIATGQNWPDALGGSALAGAYDAPILLTTKDALPGEVALELTRLGAKNAFVLGSESAVSADVFADIEDVLPGTVTRIGGADRYATANMVAAQMVYKLGASYDHKAFVATGLNYPDALAAAPLAYKAGIPVYLSGATGPSTATQMSMLWSGIDHALYLGGEAVNPMPAGVIDGAGATRIAGDDRYATAIKVADYGVGSLGMNWLNVHLTTGQNFPDALSGGASAGAWNTVMVLTKGDALTPVTASAITAHKAEIAQVVFLGGDSAIGQDVRDDVSAIFTP